MTPPNAAAVLESLRMLREDPSIMRRLEANTARLAEGLEALGLPTTPSTTPVVPVLLGDEWRAYRWARRLLEHGVFVSAVVYPAVSPGQARLRLCATAAHEPRHFERLFAGLEVCLEEEKATAG
jgi:7-keto-8-aminopelargonate synthetase-like enzyme